MIMRVMPEIAGKISEPLSKMEKMVIINSGNGPGGGASKLTGDVTQIISQLPPVHRKFDWHQVREIARTGARAEKGDGQG